MFFVIFSVTFMIFFYYINIYIIYHISYIYNIYIYNIYIYNIYIYNIYFFKDSKTFKYHSVLEFKTINFMNHLCFTTIIVCVYFIVAL
jgi:hypothetical protein